MEFMAMARSAVVKHEVDGFANGRGEAGDFASAGIIENVVVFVGFGPWLRRAEARPGRTVRMDWMRDWTFCALSSSGV